MAVESSDVRSSHEYGRFGGQHGRKQTVASHASVGFKNAIKEGFCEPTTDPNDCVTKTFWAMAPKRRRAS